MNRSIRIAFIFLCSCSSVVAQKQEQQVEEVTVSFKKLQAYRIDSIHTYLTRADIDALQPDDLGELLKKIPGANVKSFGGLGGLKTVSIRGLGSQHTNFVMDGFSQSNTQTGQVNLAQIQLDNIETVIVQRGGASELMIPVSSQMYSNAIVVQSYQSIAPKVPLVQRLSSKFGSYGQTDQHLLIKTGSEKLFGSAFMKYRHADGAYPYLLQNYNSVVKGTRKNNDYTDLNAGANFHYTVASNHNINFYFQYMQADQGLPGAVVLYNDFATQRLTSTNTQLKIDYIGKIKNLNYRVYLNRSKDSLYYLDPNYLNATGELKSTFNTSTQHFGLTLAHPIGKRIMLNLGTEEQFSDLYSRESFTATPRRWQNYSFVKSTFTLKSWQFIGQLGNQFVEETNQSGESAQSVFRVNPYLEIRKELGKKYSVYAYYRNSFRMPNFNELYYNNIGNKKLKPEDANQLAVGNSITFFDKTKFYFGIQVGGYYNVIDNMILAIPTKNLFVWSIQNIGKNEVLGADGILSMSWKFTKNWSTHLNANYAYQQSLDISDRKSPSYKNQIAYVPEHVTNLDLSLNFKGVGCRISTFTSSYRYSLNENISSNYIDGFTTIDIALFSKFKLDNFNKIRLQITIKNITDQQYAFVKNYVMPGRNYLITFNYAFD